MARHFSYDQDKVTKLRMKVIELALDVLEDKQSIKKWGAYKKEMVLKMCPRVLPLLQEHSGPDGGEIPLPILGGIVGAAKVDAATRSATPPGL